MKYLLAILINSSALCSAFFQPSTKSHRRLLPLPFKATLTTSSTLTKHSPIQATSTWTSTSTSTSHSTNLPPLSQAKDDGDQKKSSNKEERDQSEDEQWTHSDIEWRLRPPQDTPKLKRMQLIAAANVVRADCIANGQPIPPVLCPKGGQAVLEGYKDGKQIARFGFTTTPGPPALPIDETIAEIYDIPPGLGGGKVGAIIYMYVEPAYRGKNIGSLSLEAIAAIQTVQNCDFTVLVADDDGSGKLVRWYEMNGYVRAPKLQDVFGSPGEKFGVTMIRPTSVRSDIFARCQIKWW